MSTRVLIFGNSGSGKSTLARQLQAEHGLSYLDLDTLAWQAASAPQRKSLDDSGQQIFEFMDANIRWVIEGCYSDLLELATARANQIIFLDLPEQACIENAKHRPWEPHKYPSKQAQDANLEMLIDWISEYRYRADTFSYAAHKKIYDDFPGGKIIYTTNDRNLSQQSELHCIH